MEDILASIKRIIADDSQAAAAAVSHVEEVRGAPVGQRVIGNPLQLVNRVPDNRGEDDADEVLELTQTIEQAEASAPAPFPLEEDRESALRERQPRPAPVTAKPQPASSTILSDDAASASRQSLAALSALLIKPEDEAAPNTLDGLVREMLRPMLKDWLDQRLPELVETLVEKEIARITGRLG